MKKCIGYVYCDDCGKNMECNSKEGCPRQYESSEAARDEGGVE